MREVTQRGELTQVGDFYPTKWNQERVVLVAWGIGKRFNEDGKVDGFQAELDTMSIRPAGYGSTGSWRVYDSNSRGWGSRFIAGGKTVDIAFEKALALGAKRGYRTREEAETAAAEATAKQKQEAADKEAARKAAIANGQRVETPVGTVSLQDGTVTLSTIRGSAKTYFTPQEAMALGLALQTVASNAKGGK